MKNIQKFWNYMKSQYGDELEDYMEDYDLSEGTFSAGNLSKLDADEKLDLWGSLVELIMDISGMDNYGDVYELLKSLTTLREEEIEEILE